MIYEDAAEQMTVTGWVCKTCRRYWGDDEDMARWCCATEIPCKCGGRNLNKGYVCCAACRDKRDDERWAKLERVEWDGDTPLVTFDDDKYFWSAEQLGDYMGDHGLTPTTVRLTLAEPDVPRTFEMAEFLSDHLPDDHGNLDAEEIEAAVNKWIADHSPFSWVPTMKAVTAESLAVALDWQE